MMRVAWRRFRRNLGSGQHRTLLAALAVAIAALTAVGMFAERMGRLLNTEANNLLAADAVLSADHPIAVQHRGAATAAGLAVDRRGTRPRQGAPRRSVRVARLSSRRSVAGSTTLATQPASGRPSRAMASALSSA